MECNKDEAFRAKEIAERKVVVKDFAGAKKFTLKAQNLYPGLDGIAQMLTTLDVYISAENKVNGEADWYGVLGVTPSADDEMVRKQYRKLALMLHPDKNKSVGADGAFKLVSEAWSLLSDKAKRLAYNQKINFRGTQQKFPTRSGVSSMPPRPNGSYSSSSNTTSNVRTQNNNSRVGQTSYASPNKKPATFWTVCNRCKTQYEYLRIYLNHTLLCPNCHEAFLALEKAPPPNVYRSSNWSSPQQQASGHHAANNNQFNFGTNSSRAQNSQHEGLAGHGSSNTSFHWGPFSGAAGVGSNVAPPSTSAEAANVVQKAQDKVKREREEALKAADRLLKKRKDDIHVNGYVGNMATNTTTGNGAGLGSTFEPRGVFERGSIYGYSGNYNKSITERELSLFEIRNMLLGKARTLVGKRLEELSSVTEAKSAGKVKREKENKKQRSTANGDGRDPNKENLGKQSSSASSPDGSDTGISPLSMNVPDPDFHNFDLDRSESSFEDDQVWAAYDDDDGMPRFYARIHKVISLNPFKMKISWLNSRSNSEFGSVDWIGSGFSKTCGDFRSGRHEISETLNSFSHKVHWTKGTRGVIRIYPRKGDVWAIYRNWSPNWSEETPDDVIHKYDMVEVLDDYNEEQGVSVVPLVKVAGFRTVFQKHMDPKEVRRIPKEEIFRFSHQVPNYLLTGQEAHNAPMGCRELDPAATPLELLQVFDAANEAPVEEDSRKSDKSARESEADELGKTLSKAQEGYFVERSTQA